MTISASLIRWYSAAQRQLPWRQTTDPYLIWLSEVILQQTRVEQGLPYYMKFTGKYPDVKSMAAAVDDEVMKLWQGLGYYNRAANMLKTARIVAGDHNGRFPDNYNDLIGLKGIGPYTAAAIASFAFNEPHAVVDGNVYRVLSRLFAIDEPVNSTKGKKIFAELAQELLDKKKPALHNQAMMELGAMVCKPRQALCGNCPLRLHCEAYRLKRVYDFPVKEKKRKPVDRYLNFIVVLPGAYTYLRQRVDEGIWNKLYEFPCIETPSAQDAGALLRNGKMSTLFSHAPSGLQPVFAAKHQLTHQTIHAVFWKTAEKKVKPAAAGDFVKVPVQQIHDYAVPRLLERFINTILPQQ